MKKIIFLLILLLSIQLVAAETTIYDLVDSIVSSDNADGYQIVVGDEAPAADVRTTNELVSNFNNMMDGTLGYDLASSTFTDTNLILLGNPCDNPKLDAVIKCDTWPYEKGEALVKVVGSNLIIAGANPEDTRMAADAIIDYKNNDDFKTKSELMITGKMDDFEVKEVKMELKIECGDGVCAPTEKGKCEEDCGPGCNDYCVQQGHEKGECREISEEAVCLDGEVEVGSKPCDNIMSMCCCKKTPEPEPEVVIAEPEPEVVVVEPTPEPVKEVVKERNLFQKIGDFFMRIINWFKDIF